MSSVEPLDPYRANDEPPPPSTAGDRPYAQTVVVPAPPAGDAHPTALPLQGLAPQPSFMPRAPQVPVAQSFQQPWSAPMTDRQQPDTAVVVIAWVVTAFTAGYMLPWAIAATRGKANQGSVALINALVGWSLIGWVVALVMACQAHQVVRAPVAMNVVVGQQFPQTYATGSYPQAGPPPGWYPAPDGYGRQYWDGIAWTAHRAQ